jgi:hypothetical protein
LILKVNQIIKEKEMSESQYTSPEVTKFVENVLAMAKDADACMTDGVKAAGRRARVTLSSISKECKELRKSLLEKMKA